MRGGIKKIGGFRFSAGPLLGYITGTHTFRKDSHGKPLPTTNYSNGFPTPRCVGVCSKACPNHCRAIWLMETHGPAASVCGYCVSTDWKSVG